MVQRYPKITLSEVSPINFREGMAEMSFIVSRVFYADKGREGHSKLREQHFHKDTGQNHTEYDNLILPSRWSGDRGGVHT